MPRAGALLARLSNAVHMLAEARPLDKITHLHSMAQAAEQYAKAERLGDEAEKYAREIRVRAARKAGEVLREMAKRGERYARQPGVNPRELVGGHDEIATYADLGLTREQGARWQRMAAVPEPVFEEAVKLGKGEDAISRSLPTGSAPAQHGRRDGATAQQSLRGLQQAAIQIQSLAEALDGQMLGDWVQLYAVPEAQPFFEIIEQSLPVVMARLKRHLRGRSGNAA